MNGAPAVSRVALVVLGVDAWVGAEARGHLRRALETVEPDLRRAEGAVVRGPDDRVQVRWRVVTRVRRGHDPEGAWSARLALATWAQQPAARVATVLRDPDAGRRYAWRWDPARRSDAERHAAWRPPGVVLIRRRFDDPRPPWARPTGISRTAPRPPPRTPGCGGRRRPRRWRAT